MASGEIALLYHLEGDRARKVKAVLVQNRIRIRVIPRVDYLQPVGALAGVREVERTREVYDGEELAEEMLVFGGIYGKRLDTVLAGMRRAKVSVALKAVLTESNAGWSGIRLFEELEREHRKMHGEI